jgi:hypothetical protein
MPAVMKRDSGGWKVTLPTSTRSSQAPGLPVYEMAMRLLASNSRWES